MRRTAALVVCSVLGLSFLSGCSGGGSNSTSTTPTQPTPPVTPADNPAPTVTSLTPRAVLAGSPSQTINITGTGYLSSTSATFNGAAIQTTYVSATSLQATVPASALAAGQVATVVLSNPTPGGGNSAPVDFSVNSPTPAVTGLSPRVVPQGADAVITVNGSGFEANSVVMYNGSARPTTFVNGTTLQVSLKADDVKSFGTGQVTVNNPGPGGSTTTPTELFIAATSPTITYVNPNSISVNTSTNVPATIIVSGSGFAANATIQANGTFLPITAQSGTSITAKLATSFFAAAGSIQFVVTNPGSPAVQSNAATISVVVPNTNFTISPNSAPAGSPDTKITVTGTGFFKDSVVTWNNTSLSTTYVSQTQLTAIIPAALISGFAQVSIQVSTPENTGPTPPAQPFTTFLALPINDIVYNAADGLIYASIPGSAGTGLGNNIAAIDPTTGSIVKTIFVGSEPTKIALSSDGTQLFVGLNGAAAVRQVNLTTATAGTQFSLGGGPGIYNPPYTAQALAVLPGQPNSVAVYANNGVVTIYDSGVARSKTSSGLSTYFNSNSGSLAFGSSASTLYLNSYTIGSNLYGLTIDSTGVTAATSIGSGNAGGNSIQYDNNRLYLATGAVLNAANGTQLGQFSTSSTTGSNQSVAASGPIVSDSTLGRAWILPTSYSNPQNQIVAYDETTFDPIGSIPVTGVGSYGASSGLVQPADLIRWGQNGLAFHTATQLYVLQSPLVKDLTTSPADLAVSIQASATATTGTSFTYTVQVANQGQNTATGVILTTVLPAGTIGGTFTASQGSCNGDAVLYCDFGTINNGSSATLTISVTPTTAGSLSLTSYSSSVSYDPTSSNNQASAAVTVTGNPYNAAPVVTQLSPALIQAGSSTTTLTVDGTGFTSGSSVNWNGNALPTTFVSSGQLTATVDASLISQLGWAQISVTTPTPGGGLSSPMPLHIYALLNVPANAVSFDPFTRKLYAVLPSTATVLSGNSIVQIDPLTGAVGTPVQVGSEPNLLSETSDGDYMYIGLSGAKSLGRFNLLTQSLEATIPIVSTSVYNSGNVAATSMATVPGSDTSLAVQIGQAGIGIFDVSGSTGAFRSKLTGIYAGDTPVFGDATHFYAYDSETSGAEFYRYSIDSSGATLIDGTTLNGIGGFSGRVAVDGGLVFGAAGGIVNPSTTPPSQVAVLPACVGSTYCNLSAGVIPYQAESKAFTFVSNSPYSLERFDTGTFTLDQQLQAPGSNFSPTSGTRFGQDGIAYIATTSNTSGATPQIFLLRGPFVLPAEAVSNSAPTLTSTSQSTVAVGTGNIYLTITGTGFLPGATVLWNGLPRTTTYTDNAHLQVAIAAADLATAQSITLTSQNPGSGASNSITLTIQ